MKRLKRIGVVVFGLCLAGVAAELLWPGSDWVPTPIRGIEAKCFTETTPVAWSFCINRVRASRNRDVIYYFHGRNGAATWWNDETYYTGEVQKRWAELGVESPTVVGISFGRLWLLAGQGGLQTTLMDDVIARVEAEVGHSDGKRSVVGESMGGVNALVVGLQRPALFAKVAALCPPLPTVSPAASWADSFRYVRRSGTSVQRAAMLGWFGHQFYPNEELWRDNHPVPLSAKPVSAPVPRFYLSCGAKDEWGCQEGAQAIASNLKGQGAEVEWHLRPGGHCDIDVASLASFLGPD